MMAEKTISGKNRTLRLEPDEFGNLDKLITDGSDLPDEISRDYLADRTINADLLEVLPRLPDAFADLIIIDPPYNLNKTFNGSKFKAMDSRAYENYLDSWLPQVCRLLKPDGSLYLCGDWKCTSALQRALEKQLTILNRITWQREKGRGASANWKNSMEDIWFAVKNPDDYYFDLESVKIKRKVIAPYKENGTAKDWQAEDDGNFRLTCPSNFWDDISVPFWSMPENTEHPTQKSEKLYAKLILASSRPGALVFDPFLGSGTASVAAKKLGRSYCGIELDRTYCRYAAKRLILAESNPSIQGYADGVFWERNTANLYKKKS